ncbi:manganese efflux pump MntP [Candidatus Methanobinarius endosymbioticus]|uniref:Manganese efflux pump MntP n=1 Tax=Candidatus Methanobinarius endosymbioticus TaxID=2006182 RepID=A0A366MFJ5_9EURY|nr:manganese efflux pump MntP [Candidatus Methanobinarius endosymbioticus]
MDFIYLLIFLTTLAIDSPDITLSKGKNLEEDNNKENILICIIFSVAYIVMFIIGYVAGTLIEDVFSTIAQLIGLIIIIISFKNGI